MKKRINLAFNIFGGIVTLLALAFVVSTVVSQFEKKSTAANEAQTNDPVSTLQPEGLIAYVVRQADGNREIYTMRTDGSEVTNLTNNPATDESPAWSPDGTRIAFISDRIGLPEIFVMNADGSNIIQLTNISDTTSWWGPLAWSPGGKWIVASHIPTKLAWVDKGQVNLYTIDADGSGVTQITTNEVGNDTNPHWSPNGEIIAFVRTAYT